MIIHALSIPDYFIIGGIPVLILIAVFFLVLRPRSTGNGDSASEIWDTEAIDESEEPVLPTVVSAHVADMRVETGYSGGYKNAKYGVAFIIVFETEGNELLEFTVPEELYTAVEKGQMGMLVYVGKTFYDFGDGMSVDEGNAV